MSNLSAQDYLKMLPVMGAGAALIYYTVKAMRGGSTGNCCGGGTIVNPNIMKDQQKVATMVDVDELGEKTAYCRCWRSKKFPHCDGSHGKHNQETGDNVGPLVIKKKQ